MKIHFRFMDISLDVCSLNCQYGCVFFDIVAEMSEVGR